MWVILGIRNKIVRKSDFKFFRFWDFKKVGTFWLYGRQKMKHMLEDVTFDYYLDGALLVCMMNELRVQKLQWSLHPTCTKSWNNSKFRIFMSSFSLKWNNNQLVDYDNANGDPSLHKNYITNNQILTVLK